MSEVVDAALRRLHDAVGFLQLTVARRLDAEQRRGDLETELQLMQDDRARLAVELESATARLGQVEAAADHVERRVNNAVDIIQDLLIRADAEQGAQES